ncbi:MAG: sulfate adenylyltransferase subunit CysN [Epsilonproteobacteria bacterium]|nr:sulfate adenylyltransferase subunit CysN [Campylobacterota bacterium]OIO16059.1 MAG: sulfate adenylyltransferase subunit CysN [Helicobacteraceae bacterium CG1_02_36_14]PIP10229.1 MAG: sulfate adenylyltransferase subunit CysN [Sulfurimonas sp. CG23_combo_of_CG06-09_8_20_14_all_36_33]PIS26451.1 MAG: sulfate adenylyltransferase subunit CysN [Sulfurimonas sp. CG08_land_8_20_14_0_20_36_33]PIU33913.1 MAG: sulfate adenylyltransferase subunit CysN [Sulfurimonas sp. CG07_land_8_20_14_0_80_36_56]PIV0
MAQQLELIESDIESYLHQQEHKELSRFITCGSVDDGKSTLIGRLLHDSKTIFEDQLEAIKADSKRVGTTGDKIDLALLVDGLQSEREQGITIDVAYRYFSTDKRKFIIADTPGHEQYTRNMATGASTADLAIILIDARYGIVTQTRRHSYIVRLLGIRNVVVAINKMDLLDFNQEVFEKIDEEYRQFAKELGIEAVYSIPMSALDGDNVVNPSEKTPWYKGGTLINILETVPLATPPADAPFRMVVQYINRPNLDFRGFAGTIASGTISVGDSIKVLPSGKHATIKEIVTYDGNLESASTGSAITLTLNEEIDISRGNVIVKAGASIAESNKISANLVWMDEEKFHAGKSYLLKRGSSTTTAVVESINYRVDVNTQEQSNVDVLELNDIASVTLQLNDILAFDTYEENRDMGGFILIDKISNNTVAAGMITESLEKEILRSEALPFEIELNALIRRHYPHWNAAIIE